MTTWSPREGRIRGVEEVPVDEFVEVDFAGARAVRKLGFFAAGEDVGVSFVAVFVPVNPDKDRFGFGEAGVDPEVDLAGDAELLWFEREPKPFNETPEVSDCALVVRPFNVVFLVVIVHLFS